MRSPFIALLLSLPLLSMAQRSGTHGSQPWSISDSNALIWSGQPYLPVGGIVDTSPKSIQRVVAAGLKDVLIDVPANGAGWIEALAEAEKSGLRYVLRVNSAAPLARGYAVRPQSYRITGITQPRTVVVRLPGATSALTILASTRDAYVGKVERVAIQNGVLSVDVQPKSDLDHVLLIYPLVSGLEMPDFWEGLDDHRDQLLSSLNRTKPGNGLRGIVNPMGQTLSLPGRDFDLVPSSLAFQLELAQLLESRYRNMETAMRSWSMSAGFSTLDERNQPSSTFMDLARLVPLWKGVRGIPQMWDPKTDRLYPCDSKKSMVWKDITDTVNAAGVRRFGRMVSALRGAANVPVVQEWTGWASPYENPASPLDGIGIRVSANDVDSAVQAASRSVSTVLRWKSPGWLLATGVETTEVPLIVENLAQIGAKGFFLDVSSDESLQAVAAEAGRRSADTSMAQVKPQALFFPENALNPAHPQRLPGGRWWLPTPADGNRIDISPDFRAYRMNLDGVRTLAIWTKKPGRVKLRMAQPQLASFSSIDGSDPAPKLVKGGVEVTLSDYPVVLTGTDEIPVPEAAMDELIDKFGRLLAEAQARHRDATEERLAFQQAYAGFSRNPGGNYATMLDMYYRAAQRLGTFTWIEAERVQETNFSESLDVSSASNRAVLSLRTAIPPEKAYYAEYTLPVRTTLDQTVWLAAKIPPDQRKDVQVLIGGQTMVLSEAPINGYGNGYGWYRLGATKLAGGNSKLRITVVAPNGADMAFDAILLTPSAFVPDGVTPPDPMASVAR